MLCFLFKLYTLELLVFCQCRYLYAIISYEEIMIPNLCMKSAPLHKPFHWFSEKIIYIWMPNYWCIACLFDKWERLIACRCKTSWVYATYQIIQNIADLGSKMIGYIFYRKWIYPNIKFKRNFERVGWQINKWRAGRNREWDRWGWLRYKTL